MVFSCVLAHGSAVSCFVGFSGSVGEDDVGFFVSAERHDVGFFDRFREADSHASVSKSWFLSRRGRWGEGVLPWSSLFRWIAVLREESTVSADSCHFSGNTMLFAIEVNSGFNSAIRRERSAPKLPTPAT